ncbi:hypothetical protein [Syntrophothermus lipocalidus]|uniref:hypothetical protein n=1 Tax=Syntrophothermus lipocalidus TaxID=86170 RepID=UPI0002F9CBCD|nr:hypothetical protein [Syntrophothermus lipocalidus]
MIVYGALMPHPPIIVPEIGGADLLEAQATVQGMRELAQRVRILTIPTDKSST